VRTITVAVIPVSLPYITILAIKLALWIAYFIYTLTIAASIGATPDDSVHITVVEVMLPNFIPVAILLIVRLTDTNTISTALMIDSTRTVALTETVFIR